MSPNSRRSWGAPRGPPPQRLHDCHHTTSGSAPAAAAAAAAAVAAAPAPPPEPATAAPATAPLRLCCSFMPDRGVSRTLQDPSAAAAAAVAAAAVAAAAAACAGAALDGGRGERDTKGDSSFLLKRSIGVGTGEGTPEGPGSPSCIETAAAAATTPIAAAAAEKAAVDCPERRGA